MQSPYFLCRFVALRSGAGYSREYKMIETRLSDGQAHS
jgi:hypothetical protein